MPNIITPTMTSLKNSTEINESMIQEYIFDNPSVLGIGDLFPIKREKIQPAGGRLDILLDDNNDDNLRYEVEIQLGATNPSHIIRTIEYWDSERKRYPQYDHCGVIIAEEITGRFMNVISLFNGAIPLIAIQMSTIKQGSDYIISFTKILDRITYEEDISEQEFVTDRNYWESKGTSSHIQLIDRINSEVQRYLHTANISYTKYYIGTTIDGMPNNILLYKFHKNGVAFRPKIPYIPEISDSLDDSGISYTYRQKEKRYNIKITSVKEFENNIDVFQKIITTALDEYIDETNEDNYNVNNN